MIKNKIIHLRPTCPLAYDIPYHTNPIITAASPATFVAMKKMIAQL